MHPVHTSICFICVYLVPDQLLQSLHCTQLPGLCMFCYFYNNATHYKEFCGDLSGEIYTVSVKMLTGRTITLDIDLPFTIESVKRGISLKEGIPPHCQQLTFNGVVLEDGHALTDYNLPYGSSLDLTVHGSKYMC